MAQPGKLVDPVDASTQTIRSRVRKKIVNSYFPKENFFLLFFGNKTIKTILFF